VQLSLPDLLDGEKSLLSKYIRIGTDEAGRTRKKLAAPLLVQRAIKPGERELIALTKF